MAFSAAILNEYSLDDMIELYLTGQKTLYLNAREIADYQFFIAKAWVYCPVGTCLTAVDYEERNMLYRTSRSDFRGWRLHTVLKNHFLLHARFTDNETFKHDHLDLLNEALDVGVLNLLVSLVSRYKIVIPLKELCRICVFEIINVLLNPYDCKYV